MPIDFPVTLGAMAGDGPSRRCWAARKWINHDGTTVYPECGDTAPERYMDIGLCEMHYLEIVGAHD